MKGRNQPLKEMLDCFETPGSQAFVWGPRGVGKTSIAHVACEKYESTVSVACAIACRKTTSPSEIINDIIVATLRKNSSPLADRSFIAKFKGFGFEIGGNIEGFRGRYEYKSIYDTSNLLGFLFKNCSAAGRTPVIIVDEFDRLKNSETFEFIADLIKQLSVDGVSIKFVFCGVARNLDELLGAHESSERYVFGVELKPLSHEANDEIVVDIENEFDVRFHRGQKIRIAQISGGYAHFTHLILKNTLLGMFENNIEHNKVKDEDFREGVRRSAQQAATRLVRMYENATKKSTDKNIELLWAVAKGVHFDRQFKEILTDYIEIMHLRPGRIPIVSLSDNSQKLRNALNALARNGFLQKGKTGW